MKMNTSKNLLDHYVYKNHLLSCMLPSIFLGVLILIRGAFMYKLSDFVMPLSVFLLMLLYGITVSLVLKHSKNYGLIKSLGAVVLLDALIIGVILKVCSNLDIMGPMGFCSDLRQYFPITYVIASIQLLPVSLGIAFATWGVFVHLKNNKLQSQSRLIKTSFNVLFALIVFFLLILCWRFFVLVQYEDYETILSQAVTEKKSELCEEAKYDIEKCYYEYAKKTHNKSFCTKEIVGEEWLNPCNTMVK